MIDKRALFLSLGAIAALQTALLVKIVYDRHSLIKNGREIVVPVMPVDPRDLMRGDYVILGYGMGQILKSSVAGGETVAKLKRGKTVFVTLQQDATVGWKPTAVSPAYPTAVSQGDVILKARVNYNYDYGPRKPDMNATDLSVRYGIESYFVPEGTGKKIELDIREKKVEAILAVGSDGTAALKGIVVGGERHEDPPIL